MSKQDTPMDALDQRLAAYLRGRAETAAGTGPGPEDMAAAIATRMGRAMAPSRRSGTSLHGVSAIAWALLAIALLAALAIAITAGSDRDDRLVVFPSVSAGPSVTSPTPTGAASLEGMWWLDFEASGIDGSYELTSGGKRTRIPVGSSIDLAGGAVSGLTGAGGGCDAFKGTYRDADGRFTIAVPTTAGHCGQGPGFPDLEVRKRLAAAAAWDVEGETLRLLDANGTLLLLYRRPATGAT